MREDFQRLLPSIKPVTGNKIAIIGAGIAGLCLADTLLQRNKNWQVSIYDMADGPGQGGSGNALGYLSPRTGNEVTPALTFYAAAWRYALAWYRQHGVLMDRPLLFLADSARKYGRLERYLATGLVDGEMLSVDEICQRAGTRINALGGLWLPDSGMVSPNVVCQTLYEKLAGRVAFHFNHQIDDLASVLQDHDAVILATASSLPSFKARLSLPSSTYRGQISHIPNDNPDAVMPVISGNGYICTSDEVMCFGATFDPIDQVVFQQPVQESDHLRNLDKIKQFAPDMSITHAAIKGRASIRAASPDRMAYCGAMPDIEHYQHHCRDMHLGQHWKDLPEGKNHDNIFVMTCLGARGFSTAPMMADMLAKSISGDPLSGQELEWLQILHPARFLVSDLRRAPVDRRWYQS